MDSDLLGEVLLSKIRLRIMNALSLRPRTLGELADLTGISVQGVIRHLKRLESLGLVDERRMEVRTPKARIVYAGRNSSIGDYSTGDLTAVKATNARHGGIDQGFGKGTPEEMAGELIVQRRRVKEEAKRLGKAIDELVEYQRALEAMLERMHLTQREHLILEVLLTEETVEEGRRALSGYYGLEDRRSIDEALAKARRVVK